MEFKALVIAINNIEVLRKYNLRHYDISRILRRELLLKPHYGDKYYNVYFNNLRFKFRVKDYVYKLIFVKEYKR